eukprot:157691-Amphidinium_carterae.1
MLLPGCPDPVDHGQECYGSALTRFLSPILGELEVQHLSELVWPTSLLLKEAKKDFKTPYSLRAKGLEFADGP